MKALLTSFIAICLAGTIMASEPRSGQLNEQFSWTLADSVLTIHGTGKMPGFNSTNLDKLPWQDERFAAEVAKIVISEGITEVGSYCFGSRIKVRNVRNAKEHTYYNTQDATTSELFCNIKDVSLPSTLQKIRHHAFARMPLTHIVLPEALEEIGAGAFTNCALQCVILPEKIRKVGNESFCGCQNLRAVDFNNAAIKLAGGMFFDAERLRLLMHTGNIKGVASTTFNSTALDGIGEEELLEMFRTDGAQYYLSSYLPERSRFTGSEEEYAELEARALDRFYVNEAKNATSLFELDRFILSPYDVESGTCRIETVHNGTLLLSLTREQADALSADRDSILSNATPVFTPRNGKVELQSVKYRIGDDVVVAAKL